jgi:hypothetical protein
VFSCTKSFNTVSVAVVVAANPQLFGKDALFVSAFDDETIFDVAAADDGVVASFCELLTLFVLLLLKLALLKLLLLLILLLLVFDVVACVDTKFEGELELDDEDSCIETLFASEVQDLDFCG